jgi:hypothetical protein
MRRTGCPETSVSNYQSTMPKIPEQRIFYEKIFSDFRVVSCLLAESQSDLWAIRSDAYVPKLTTACNVITSVWWGGNRGGGVGGLTDTRSL